MMSFFKRRIQPIQQRHTLGFEYMDAEDPSRMCVEELTDDAALIQVKQVLLDLNTVPYHPRAILSTKSSRADKVLTSWKNFCCFGTSAD
jgi:hypothetical protein